MNSFKPTHHMISAGVQTLLENKYARRDVSLETTVEKVYLKMQQIHYARNKKPLTEDQILSIYEKEIPSGLIALIFSYRGTSTRLSKRAIELVRSVEEAHGIRKVTD